ncbi:hypothetical protein HDV02_000936, partial [Globomyces sp. JEL0801]
MSLKTFNYATLAISTVTLLGSIILDVKNRKTAGLTTANGIIGLILRISLFIWSIESLIVYIKGETYVIDNLLMAEQRVGITPYFVAAQLTISLSIMCLFATFLYYWVSVSSLLPNSKLLGH